MKVLVMGYSGSGKSTLARTIALDRQLPLLHMDQVNFVDNWHERDNVESETLVRSFISQENWVIDGNYRKFFYEERLEKADKIYLLLFSRWNCLWRVLKRTKQYFGRSRPDMADNCPEKLDWEFLLWILYYGRTKDKRASYQSIKQTYGEKVVMIRNQRELDNIYQTIS